VFTRQRFELEDGPMCGFEDVQVIPGGYRIVANCKERGNSGPSTFTLRFAESAKAMLVEDLASLPDTGLIYCGPG
jgi:hypothetical protein